MLLYISNPGTMPMRILLTLPTGRTKCTTILEEISGCRTLPISVFTDDSS